MTAPSPLLEELLDEDFAWTPRQRQVLSLLADGRTNGEIADELGISLDGAKWHVREVLSKLNVQSRDEAAEYWRAYNGWPRRLRRGFGAMSLGLPLRWAGGIAGAVLLAGIVAAVAVVLLQDGDGREAAAPDVTPTVVATEPAATMTATPDVGNDDAPGDGFPAAEIDGVPVEEMEIGEAVELPEGLVMYFQMLVPETDGGRRNAWRAYRDASGTTHVEDLLKGLPTEREWVLSVAVAPERGELMIAACDGEPCSAPYLLPETTVKVFRSTNGGISWEDYGTLPDPGYLLGLLDDGNVIISGEEPSLYPSGEVLEPPANIDDAWPTLVNGLGLVWIDHDRRHYTADGDEL